MNQEPDIFDRIAAQPATPLPDELQKDELSALDSRSIQLENTSKTAQNLRKALQFLLSNGWLESTSKPQLFRLIAAQTARLDTLLEPLDLRVVVDDVRGLAFWPWCRAMKTTMPTKASRTTGRTR